MFTAVRHTDSTAKYNMPHSWEYTSNHYVEGCELVNKSKKLPVVKINKEFKAKKYAITSIRNQFKQNHH
jgi:hypothetical protein